MVKHIYNLRMMN